MTIDSRFLHAWALVLAAAYVDDIQPEEMSRPTPCADWNLADLLAHMVGQHRGFALAVSNGSAPVTAYEPSAFTLPGWHHSVAALLVAIADADLDDLATAVELSPTPLPVNRIINAQLLDTIVHTWDIAQARGRSFRPPEKLLQPLGTMVAAIPDQARGPGAAFAGALPSNGTSWQHALATVGRDEQWQTNSSPASPPSPGNRG